MNMMIQIQNLLKKFQNKIAVDISDLTIEAGEMIGLVGNNGAGKTTLLRLILDLIKADRGHVSSNGEDVSKSESWKAYTGSYLDEDFNIEFLTPEEFFIFITEEYGIPRTELKQKLGGFQSLFDGQVLGQNKKYIRDFSKGNKQKIGIASALMTDPKVLILDEPFSNLDPSSQIFLKNFLKDYHTRSSATMIISSHDLKHVTEICTRIILIEHGKVIRDMRNESDTLAQLESYFSSIAQSERMI